jgi:phosphatidylserine/phosphatidylglycerophosphate/cardiolipin synthase-like enzyme
MLELSSTDAAIASIESAKLVLVEAYTLHGPVLRALEDAARRGARVQVELERVPFDDAQRHLGRENARIAAELRRAGADARLDDPIHAKTISVDGTLFLDEKNWHEDDIVLRADDPASIPMTKREALDREAELLCHARACDGVVVESESFGSGNATYRALKALGLAGAAPRLLVSERDLRGSPRERAALSELTRDGVRVRICGDSAKLAVSGNRAWLGSANATYADGRWAMPDWGLCTGDAAIARTVRQRLEREWAGAREFKAAVKSAGSAAP